MLIKITDKMGNHWYGNTQMISDFLISFDESVTDGAPAPIALKKPHAVLNVSLTNDHPGFRLSLTKLDTKAKFRYFVELWDAAIQRNDGVIDVAELENQADKKGEEKATRDAAFRDEQKEKHPLRIPRI